MNGNPDPEERELADALDRLSSLPPSSLDPLQVSDRLRAEILGRTSRIIRRRKAVRRTLLSAAAVALFGMGIAAGRWSLPARAERPQELGAALPRPAAASRQEGGPPDLAQGSRVPPAAAGSPGGSRAQELLDRLRAEGDRLLSVEGDAVRALDYYRQVLELEGAKGATVRPQETWLLASLRAGGQSPETVPR